MPTCNTCGGTGQSIASNDPCWNCSGTGTVSATVNRIQNHGGDKIDNNGGCFPAGTMIATPHGLKPIETINSNDSVSSWDVRNNCMVSSLVLLRTEHDKRKTVSLYLDDGSCVTTTGVHSFLTPIGWKRADALLIGDHIVQSAGRDVAISSIQQSAEVTVFNLITDGHHNFIADGCVVHNFTHFRSIRSFLWDVYAALVHSRRRQRRLDPVQSI